MYENQPLVSIIMPVYNCEEYLPTALESIIVQEYRNWELLIIDDNSTDSSSEIIKVYEEIDNRIIFLENTTDIHGPGPTRNIGLNYVKGEYLYFMDADDWVDKNLLQCAIKRIQETNADIVQFGAIHERNDGNNSEKYFWSGKNLLTKDEIKKDFFNYWKDNRNSLWLHLFRRETVKTIRFENIINGEDISYVMDALCSAEKIAYIAEAFYHYRYVEGSTSHHWVENTIECLTLMWNHQRKFLESFQGDMNPLVYAVVAYDDYSWALYQLGSRSCPLTYREKRKELLKLEKNMGFDEYRDIYPLEMQHGLMKVKFMFVKYHFESMILLFGSLYYRVIRGECISAGKKEWKR